MYIYIYIFTYHRNAIGCMATGGIYIVSQPKQKHI